MGNPSPPPTCSLITLLLANIAALQRSSQAAACPGVLQTTDDPPFPVYVLFIYFFFSSIFLAPHLGHIYICFYCTFITLCADYIYGRAAAVVDSLFLQLLPSFSVPAICCICWQWPGPFLLFTPLSAAAAKLLRPCLQLLHPLMKLLPKM